MFDILTFIQFMSQFQRVNRRGADNVTGLAGLKPGPALQQGFTLIEIMVVVIIIGLLAAIVAPNVIGRIDDAQITRAKADIANIDSALKFYRLDNFSYPTTEQGLQALVSRPADPNIKNWKPGGYLDRLPNDPWKNPYLYLFPGNNGEIDIYTLGRDGRPGGEGVDADIGNWSLE
jgi:general secretion pathway protein G